ncbi:MAG TPA: NAD(P)H-hydrate dehydratase [Streptosporangiaceae bacterium]|nr:NAD(P)H-hydrate dehydratase [Streptosporangiaceae bacterium]
MRNAHATADVRTAEQALMSRLPAGTLMSRAAAGLASVCAGLLGQVYGSRVAILAGSGDNGGDALYAGALLARRGAVVTALAASERLHEPGAAALRGAGGRVLRSGAGAADAAAALGRADLIIDGLLGIGGRGGLREPAAGLAAHTEAARRDGAIVVAVDLPSGVDADTGVVAGPAIRADVTVTFGTWKPGLLIDPGASHAGAAELIDIGLAPSLGPPAASSLQAADVAALLPRPAAESDKYRRGVLGLLAGSARYTGAAVLATGSAIHGGAGMVRLVSAEQARTAARQHWPEAVVAPTETGPPEQVIEEAGQVQAWAAGPGMGTGDDAAGLLAAVLATSLPVLVDADGITLLARHPALLPRSAPTLITPHAGELSRLTGADRDSIEARRLEHATAAAAKLGVTVLLKGSTTVIADPAGTGPALINPTGTPWLATAGSGDVLSGLAGALLAQGLPPAQAAAAAAYLHGVAARLAADDAPIGAGDLIAALPAAIRSVTRSRS